MIMQLSAERFDTVLFDLDGVLTDTAAVQARAWKTLFDACVVAGERRLPGKPAGQGRVE